MSTRIGCMSRTLVVLGMELGIGDHGCLAWWSRLLLLCVQVENHALLSTLQQLYTVGYSLSIVSLLLALTLLLCLRWVELLLACAQAYTLEFALEGSGELGWMMSWLIRAGRDLREPLSIPSICSEGKIDIRCPRRGTDSPQVTKHSESRIWDS